MATNLKRVNLMLDEALTNRLRPALERIRRLRDAVGPMPDSTAVVRESRDRGW